MSQRSLMLMRQAGATTTVKAARDASRSRDSSSRRKRRASSSSVDLRSDAGNTEFSRAIVMVEIPAAEAHLRAKAALYRATEHLELIWRKVVHREIKRRRDRNHGLLRTLLPWLRTTVDAHEVRAELEQAMAAEPERAKRSKWWTAQQLQRNRARVAQAVLANAHAARNRGETHISVARGEWAWLDPTHRGESATNHDETRMLLKRKL